eukprot:Seg8445.1 transcript_id=Seg8445.1/GoldUCD/mRNA.D3Y31 product="hypothetical protein" protein_id=Seg8445.1/GoldUCD/D3Y31
MDYLGVKLCEDDIPGAKWTEDIEEMTRKDTLRWLKCRNARKICSLPLKELQKKLKLYIENGWNLSRLKDPDEGKHIKSILHTTFDEDKIELVKIIESPPASDSENWTQNIQSFPLENISHSDIESYFCDSGDKKHQEQGYVFSKTQKFETSGRPMQVMIIKETYILLEGYTRPSTKSSKGIHQGRGLYRCVIVYSLENGKILQASDYSCPAAGGQEGSSTLQDLRTNLLIVLEKEHTSEAFDMHTNEATMGLTCIES